jgi:gamma-glutamyl-gamma-aminobutyrate hydrolase PuuD
MLHGARPLIGINGELTADTAPAVLLKNRYADAVLKAGGIPVAIPPVGGPSDLRRLIERLDGVLLSGGDDFDTARLGLGPTHPAARPVPSAKQDFDLELVRACLEVDLPLLGICYGMQLLALAEGGALHQHLPDDRPACRSHSGGVLHAVKLVGGSRMRRIVERDELEVVSRHHQAVAHTGSAWTACAHDDEGLIEAIERPASNFALGVQWHPELAGEGSAHDRLFRALVFAAATRVIRRDHSGAGA